MKLSVVIPAHNEEGSIAVTIRALHGELLREGIAHEILVVNDHSKDSTSAVLAELQLEITSLRIMDNEGPGGYGHAVRLGLAHFTGERVAVMMADLSDDPADLVRFHRKMDDGFDCVFGTRWSRGGSVQDYPLVKRSINRLANNLVQLTFRMKYNDCTNAFKLYSRAAIEGIQPLLAPHFNLTLEMPLKAIVRGYSYAVLPNSWRNRKTGESKLKIQEMGSRYFFILLYCLIEKYFSKGDFKKPGERR